MNISVTVMAHPKRTGQAEALFNKLTGQGFTGVSITWDSINDEWDTGERALRSGLYEGSNDWHIVVQDDAIICDDFYANAVQAISKAPQRTLISFYTGTVRPFKKRVTNAVKQASNGSWLAGYTLFWGVGIAIPVDHIEPVLEFCNDEDSPYDTRIGLFYFRNMMPVLYTNPSLVNHNDDLGSLIGNDKSVEPRVAHNFIDGPVKWTSQEITHI